MLCFDIPKAIFPSSIATRQLWSPCSDVFYYAINTPDVLLPGSPYDVTERVIIANTLITPCRKSQQKLMDERRRGGGLEVLLTSSATSRSATSRSATSRSATSRSHQQVGHQQVLLVAIYLRQCIQHLALRCAVCPLGATRRYPLALQWYPDWPRWFVTPRSRTVCVHQSDTAVPGRRRGWFGSGGGSEGASSPI